MSHVLTNIKYIVASNSSPVFAKTWASEILAHAASGVPMYLLSDFGNKPAVILPFVFTEEVCHMFEAVAHKFSKVNYCVRYSATAHAGEKECFGCKITIRILGDNHDSEFSIMKTERTLYCNFSHTGLNWAYKGIENCSVEQLEELVDLFLSPISHETNSAE